MQKTVKQMIFLGVFCTAIFFWGGYQLLMFWRTPLIASNQEPLKIVLVHGNSAKGVASLLKEKNLLRYPLCFMLYVRGYGIASKLQAGEYIITPGMTLPQLLNKMAKGEVIRHAFTIIEGWTFAQILHALHANKYLVHTINDLSTADIMARIGRAGELPEGRFAPDTYLFRGKATDLDILRASYNLMANRLAGAWEGRARGVKYKCPYEALIVASLIEKETAVMEEKPKIAGIILRRLERGMLLQIDPSVIYGLGKEFTGKLHKVDLRKDTPYNTYLHKGLPPIPIAASGQDSLEAALNPAYDNYLYYVAKKDGTHRFAASLVEHNVNVKKFLLRKQ